MEKQMIINELFKSRIDITVKSGTQEMIHLKGKASANHLTVEDMQGMIHLEAYLERLTGYRFHIFLVAEGSENE